MAQLDSEIPLTPLNRPSETATRTDSVDRQHFSLPQADGGKDAWLFLAAAFLTEGLVWGLPFAFGIFQEHYSSHPPFEDAPGGLAIVGTLQTGINYLSGPVMFALFLRSPSIQRPCLFLGIAILCISMIAASFASRVWHLILTQGVVYGIGSSLVYFPTLAFIQEWFITRRGLAFGVMWAGSGSFGSIVPLAMNFGLERFGFRNVLRAWAVMVTFLSVPLLKFVKPRVPISANSRSRPIDLRFLQSRVFWVFQFCNILEGLGYFIPMIYLPSIAKTIGSSAIAGTSLTIANNLATVVGGIIAGWLVDRFEVTAVIAVISACAALACFLAWGLAESYSVLLIFALLYGLFAGGYSTSWAGVCKAVQQQHTGADSAMVLGMFGFGRGIGSVASGPLSEALLNHRGLSGTSLSYGQRYGSLVVFTGSMMAAGGLSGAGRMLGWI